jgi:hypothetical protein
VSQLKDLTGIPAGLPAAFRHGVIAGQLGLLSSPHRGHDHPMSSPSRNNPRDAGPGQPAGAQVILQVIKPHHAAADTFRGTDSRGHGITALRGNQHVTRQHCCDSLKRCPRLAS